jgi:hypothetical protein
VCGDASCNGAETCTSCSGDCGACPTSCGNGACEAAEDCTTCAADCGACNSGPLPIPGTVEGEAYESGGEGVGYHDITAGNLGDGACRSDDVDLKAGGSGCIVGWFDRGEWLAYSVNVQSAGRYLLEARVARGASGTSRFHLEADGTDVSGPVDVPSTGSWDTLSTVQAVATLPAGSHTLRLVNDVDFFDLDWLRLTVLVAACGNGACDPNETCSSCSQDCGSCPVTSCTGVNVGVTDDLQSAINANPSGTTFCIKAGVHRMTNYVIPKNDDVFRGEAGSVLNGAKIVSTFTFDGTHWVASGQTQQNPVVHGSCAPSTYLGCQYADAVFFDDQPLWRVMSLAEMGPGKFYFDYAADKFYLADNPTGHKVEAAVAPQAFKGWGTGISNVSISGLVVEKFANAAQVGAVETRDWDVEDCEVRLNHGIGIMGGRNIRRNYVHHNGEMGLGGSGVLVEDNEISYNNTAGFDAGWEGGGTKWVLTADMIVRGNYSHHNKGPGLWTDGNNIRITYEDNRCEYNDGPGIDHEISYDAVIRRNVLINNSQGWSGGKSLWWGANLHLNNSQNVEIYDNTIEGSANAIALVDIDRGSGNYGVFRIANINIHDNVIKMNGGTIGLVNSGRTVDTASIRFTHNTYYLANLAGAYFMWTSGALTKDGWKAVGQDTTSSFLPW